MREVSCSPSVSCNCWM